MPPKGLTTWQGYDVCWVMASANPGKLALPPARLRPGKPRKEASDMARITASVYSSHVPAIGEVGYRGGAIRRHGAGYLLAAFSGGTSDEDYAISERALSALEKLI